MEKVLLAIFCLFISCSDYDLATYDDPIKANDGISQKTKSYLDSLKIHKNDNKDDSIFVGDFVLSDEMSFPDSIKIFDGNLTITKDSEISYLKSGFTVNGNFSLIYSEIVSLENIIVNGNLDISGSDVIDLKNITINGILFAKDMLIFPDTIGVFVRDSIVQ